MTPDILTTLKELNEKRSPGPWDNRVNEMSNQARARYIWSEYGFIGRFDDESAEANAEFIATLANSFAELSSRLEFAESVIRDANKRLDPSCEDTGQRIAKRLQLAEDALEDFLTLGIMQLNIVGGKLERAAMIDKVQAKIDAWREVR